MKIAIICRNPDLYSHQRLITSGFKRGHQVMAFDPLSCYIHIVSGKPTIHYRGIGEIGNFDAIIPRIGASITFYGTAVVRQFEMMGTYVLNNANSISLSRDKLRSLQVLSKYGIPLPVTGFAHSQHDTDELIKMVGGAPLIVKLLEGTQGLGVMITDSTQSAQSVINAFKQLKAHVIVQEFLKEAQGADIRCFVVGSKVVASMQRKAKEGEFRSNLHRGGTSKPIEITNEERKMAIKAAKILGLNVAGVDILRTPAKSVVIEVNSSPGLEGIERATKIDVASNIIEFIEQNYRRDFMI